MKNIDIVIEHAMEIMSNNNAANNKIITTPEIVTNIRNDIRNVVVAEIWDKGNYDLWENSRRNVYSKLKKL